MGFPLTDGLRLSISQVERGTSENSEEIIDAKRRNQL
jgi:hypothetical protein